MYGGWIVEEDKVYYTTDAGGRDIEMGVIIFFSFCGILEESVLRGRKKKTRIELVKGRKGGEDESTREREKKKTIKAKGREGKK
jgi:hypothetical protein